MFLYHYTDKRGYNSIKASPTWVFKAHQPPRKENPIAAYFTKLDPKTPLLARKLRVGNAKIEYVFQFDDTGDLKRLNPDRDLHVFISEKDYNVDVGRQRFHGLAIDWSE